MHFSQLINTHGQKKSDVCKRCARIPWEDGPFVGDPGRSQSISNARTRIFQISEDRKQLSQSSCRVCRFLATFFGSTYHKYLDWERNEYDAPNIWNVSNDTRPRSWGNYIAVSRDSGPLIANIDIFKGWIECCLTKHAGCNPTLPTLHSLKVIDCERRSVALAPENCRFVALSYVWDNAHTVETVSWIQMPKTVRDSIILTRRLGYRYLWVDNTYMI